MTPAVILAAVGQAFFSLSLGMGAMITYGSYVSKDQDLETSAGWVTGFDTLIAFLAGLIIFPTLFHAGLDPNQSGPGMVFVVLTSLLSTIPPAPVRRDHLRHRLLPAAGHRGAHLEREPARGRHFVGRGREGLDAEESRLDDRRGGVRGRRSERAGQRGRVLAQRRLAPGPRLPELHVRDLGAVLARGGRPADQPLRGVGVGRRPGRRRGARRRHPLRAGGRCGAS